MTGTDVRERILARVAASTRSSERTGEAAVLRLSNVGSCLRKSWYVAFARELGLTTADREARATWEAEDGDLHEVDLVRRFEADGYTMQHVRRDFTTEPGWVVKLRLPDSGAVVTGHPDGLIVAGPGITAPTLFEAKSMSAGRYVDTIVRAFDTMPGTRKAEVVDWESPPDWVRGLRLGHPEYWLQSQGYLLAENLTHGLMVIKAKDSSTTTQRLRPAVQRGLVNAKLHIVAFTADPESQAVVIERMETLVRAVREGTPPPGEYHLLNNDWQCRLCPFVQICPNGLGAS